MSSNHASPSPNKDFEDKDIRLKPILWFFFWTALFTAGTFAAILFFQKAMEKRTAQNDIPISEFATEPIVFPEPRLQVDELRTWAQQKAHDAAKLHAYAWVDKAGGVVQIPIDRAMELVVERGLPAREAEAAK